MPRRSRIDAPGALHHIILRGIERSNIFRDDTDRDAFIERLSFLIQETATALAGRIGITQPAVSTAVQRGREIVLKDRIDIEKLIELF